MIKLDPQDRLLQYPPRNLSVFGIIIAVVVVLVGCGGLYYWYSSLQRPDYSEVYRRLGIPRIPPNLERKPEVQARLDQLSHEPCYREGILGLTDELLEAGYPHDADTALANFASRCGKSDSVLLQRHHALYQAGDFSAAVHVADDLIRSDPADAQLRYWRGNAYQELRDFEHALVDYINAVQLLGEPDTISVNNFYDISRMYAALKRYCDAITPIETYISFDPVSRRTAQITRLITEYAEKGHCDVKYASGFARVSRLPSAGSGGVNILTVAINGVSGNFLLDTGATYVSVTPNFASRAKLNVETGMQIPMKTVGGTASADLAYANTVNVDKAEAQGVPVAVIKGAVDPFGRRLDGLLGMSFLARFKVNLSRDAIELAAIPLR
jgi:aspartyl protease family protein